MNSARYQGLFLDDRENQAHYTTYLTVEGKPGLLTEFQLVQQPLEEMAGTVLRRHPDILALDYRLDDAQVGVRYKAGPLAQQLRDHASAFNDDDFPIVLLSSENIIQEQYAPDLTTHDLFDRVYAKEVLLIHQQRIGKELLALAEGYKAIISNFEKKETRLAQLLELTADEQGNALLNNQELRTWQDLKAPHLLAKKVLRNIIDRNGLLLDRCSLLARLGIAKDSPDIDAILAALEIDNTSYRGIFHGGWKRWWSHRIEVFGEQACGNELGNLTAKERVECWNRLFGLKLVAAKSQWIDSDETFPSFACDSCTHPTEKIHSVAAFDHAPSFVERKRICWQCIATGAYENTRLIPDDAEAYIVEKIKNGEIKGEA